MATTASQLNADPAERTLVITRVFDAPRELVFKAWTDKQHAMMWWGPKHHPATQVDMDVRPGGRWRHCLKSVETGKDLWHRGSFLEVVPPERLVFTFAWEEAGERGLETLVTVTFEELGGQNSHDHAPDAVPVARRARRSWRRLVERVRPPGRASHKDLGVAASPSPAPRQQSNRAHSGCE